MSLSTLQRFILRLAKPLRWLISFYSLLLLGFAIMRLLRITNVWWIDLANAFAPHWFTPLIITFPVSVIVTRQIGKRQPPRWSVAIQIILIALGIVWFLLPTMQTHNAPPTGETFKAITYNILGRNSDLSKANDWLIAQNPDLIILQETGEAYDWRLSPLYRAYPHEAHINGNVRVFSRYEILSRQLIITEDYPPGHLTLKLVVNQNGRELAVYATHFVLPIGDKSHLPIIPDLGFPINFALRYDETRRNAQIRRLIDILKQEPLPFILAGDFNTSDQSLIYDELASVMVDSFREAGGGSGRTWPVAKVIGAPPIVPPLIRIDYLLHSSQLRALSASVGKEPIGSDHLPVIVTLEWLS